MADFPWTDLGIPETEAYLQRTIGSSRFGRSRLGRGLGEAGAASARGITAPVRYGLKYGLGAGSYLWGDPDAERKALEAGRLSPAATGKTTVAVPPPSTVQTGETKDKGQTGEYPRMSEAETARMFGGEGGREPATHGSLGFSWGRGPIREVTPGVTSLRTREMNPPMEDTTLRDPITGQRIQAHEATGGGAGGRVAGGYVLGGGTPLPSGEADWNKVANPSGFAASQEPSRALTATLRSDPLAIEREKANIESGRDIGVYKAKAGIDIQRLQGITDFQFRQIDKAVSSRLATLTGVDDTGNRIGPGIPEYVNATTPIKAKMEEAVRASGQMFKDQYLQNLLAARMGGSQLDLNPR